MRELDKVLNDNEKVFWEGNPKVLPFVFGGNGLLFLLMVFGAVLAFLNSGQSTVTIDKQPTLINNPLSNPFFLIGLFLALGLPLLRELLRRNTYYAITDKRVVFQTGIIGRDFNFVDFDKITNAEVRVDLFDQLFGGSTGSGSIAMMSAGTYTSGKHGPVATPYVISNVPYPYEVFKFFKKVSHDVKTDIEYPNEYRPSTNPGYKSSYKPTE